MKIIKNKCALFLALFMIIQAIMPLASFAKEKSDGEQETLTKEIIVKIIWTNFPTDEKKPDNIYLKFLIKKSDANNWSRYGGLVKLEDEVKIVLSPEHYQGYEFFVIEVDENGNPLEKDNFKNNYLDPIREDDRLIFTLENIYNSNEEPSTPTDPEQPVDPDQPTDPEQPGDDVEKPDTDRIFGKDRIETAIELSKKKFEKAETVIIARHDVFADALVAGPLAYALDAPILLTKSTELLPKVAAEIERLGANYVIIVGGLGSIDENVEKELRKYDEKLQRLEGPSRYETAVKVADRLKKSNGGTGRAIIATGVTYPDALSVGPFAASNGNPILLVKPNEVPEVVKEAFTRLEIKEIFISGGEASVGKELEKEMPKLLVRFSGQDRYATAVDIAKQTNPDAKNIYIASGEVFADALVAGPASKKDEAPMLLTRRNEAPSVLKDYFKNLNIEKLTVIGGANTITDESVDSIFK